MKKGKKHRNCNLKLLEVFIYLKKHLTNGTINPIAKTPLVFGIFKLMKKITLSLFATVLLSNLNVAQATLEHTYTTKELSYDQSNAFKTEAGLHYFTIEGTNTMKIYNSSHSLLTTVTLPIDSGYELNGIYGASDKLFNSDASTEFLVFTVNDTNGNLTYKLTLVSQNGAILQQFGDRGDAQIIKGTNGEYKLITIKNIYDTYPTANNYSYDVYALPGTTLGTVLLNKNASLFFGYPNPAENKIAIINNIEGGQQGILEIFDINGKKVMQKNVTSEDGEIMLDIAVLKSGVYVYKLNGQTNKFVKK